jgi:O-glycosyl hydrolase
MRKNIRVICLLMLCMGYALLTNGASLKDTILTIHIYPDRKAQTIENFGSSGCWFSEGIGKYWPAEKKEKIASLLFSRKFDSKGQPEGIGLSAWRFNIGAGTLEQGDSSGIKDFRKRSDSFLNPDGTYDWTKQAGYRFFLQKAKDYGVETLIAFSNSPPVQFTKNGLGFKTEKDYRSNLREDSYNAYASFLASVIRHFDQEGLHFDYISPVNEPQWDWSRKYKEADQEGSPWRNEEIYKVTKALNTALETAELKSKILVTEAGMLSYLYGGSGAASRQIQNFFNPKSPMYMGDLSHVPKLIAGHSYFTEANDKVLLDTRRQLADTIKSYGLNYWQSEYSMLGDGFKEGSKERRSNMDCALFLSKVIHTDLVIGNAAAWQFWNAYEPGSAAFNTRYYLIALQPDADFKNGEFSITKNLWALGHYSRFIRPGMTRVMTEKTMDNSKADEKNLMVSAYVDKDNKMVVVGTNYGTAEVKIKLDLRNAKKKYGTAIRYLTTAADDVNMKPEVLEQYTQVISLPARSISTIVVE